MHASSAHTSSSPVWGDGNPKCCRSSPSSSRRRASVDRRDWLRELVRPAAAGWAQVSILQGPPLSLATTGQLGNQAQSTRPGHHGSLLVGPVFPAQKPSLSASRAGRPVVTCRTAPLPLPLLDAQGSPWAPEMSCCPMRVHQGKNNPKNLTASLELDLALWR